jgi:hypothetical protein
MGIRMFLLKHLTSLVDPILRQRIAGLSRVSKAILTGASESTSSSNKSAFGRQINSHSNSSPKSASTYIWLWKTAESDTYWEKKSIISIPHHVGMGSGPIFVQNAESGVCPPLVCRYLVVKVADNP